MDTPLSARSLRQQLRGDEHARARHRLVEDAALLLARGSSLDDALAAVVATLSRFTAFSHLALLELQAGGLVVRAARGGVVPPGTRLPMRGALGAVLKPPPLGLLREEVETALLLGPARRAACEWLVPLVFLGQPRGVLALLSLHRLAAPDDADQETLRAVTALLAAALGPPAAESSARGRRPAPAPELARLTARERQVLALLPRGLGNRPLAEALGIAPGTVKVHVERILHKLGVADRTQAAVRAVEWGLKA